MCVYKYMIWTVHFTSLTAVDLFLTFFFVYHCVRVFSSSIQCILKITRNIYPFIFFGIILPIYASVTVAASAAATVHCCDIDVIFFNPYNVKNMYNGIRYDESNKRYLIQAYHPLYIYCVLFELMLMLL